MDMGQNRVIAEQKYSRIKAKGLRMIIQVLGSWRRQERQNGGIIKRISRQSRKTRDSVHSPVNLRGYSKTNEEIEAGHRK